MGIKEVFEGGADLTNMLEGHDAYVNEAVHKTYVKVDEKGTKAAAVTYFGIKDNAAVIEDDKEYVSVIFDKPFIFMIKDHNSHEILFFGVVYSPEKWNGKNTCE
jgi:serpin B